MTTVPQLARLLQTLVTVTANHCGRETGFIQRQGKVTGALFLQTLLCGWLSAADATLELRANTGHSCGLDISPQGVDARFTERAATFLKAVLDAAITISVSTVGVTVGLIGRFAGVYLVDSTQIALPDSLVAVWRGTGSTTGRRAALKTQVQLDLTTGALTAELMAGRCHDRTAAAQHAAVPKGALRVADLGYDSLAVLAAFSSAGVYWVSRISSQTCLVVDGSRSICTPFWRHSMRQRAMSRCAWGKRAGDLSGRGATGASGHCGTAAPAATPCRQTPGGRRAVPISGR